MVMISFLRLRLRVVQLFLTPADQQPYQAEADRQGAYHQYIHHLETSFLLWSCPQAAHIIVSGRVRHAAIPMAAAAAT